MKIVIAGAKGAGKSTVAEHLERLTGLKRIETDQLIEDRFANNGQRKTCRQLYIEYGSEVFRAAERQVVEQLEGADWQLIVCGGSSLVDPASRRTLRKNAIVVYLKADAETLWTRMVKDGLPPWLQGPDARQQHEENVARREELLSPFADLVIADDGAFYIGADAEGSVLALRPVMSTGQV